jgi:hypothetical protein
MVPDTLAIASLQIPILQRQLLELLFCLLREVAVLAPKHYVVCPGPCC